MTEQTPKGKAWKMHNVSNRKYDEGYERIFGKKKDERYCVHCANKLTEDSYDEYFCSKSCKQQHYD